MVDDHGKTADVLKLRQDLDKLESLLEDIEQCLQSDQSLSADDAEMLRKLRELCSREKELFKKITGQKLIS